MATTNSPELCDKMQLYRSHGVTRNSALFESKENSIQPWYYEQHSLGYNYRISDINAALGLAQLSKLNYFVRQRNELASLYTQQLKDVGRLCVPSICARSVSSFHLYVVRIEFSSQIEKVEMFNFFSDRNVNLNVHYIPIHTQPYFNKLGFKVGDYPLAELYYRQAVSLPIYPTLDIDEVIRVTKILKEFLS